MPLISEKAHGTNADGIRNPDYCHHCYQNGQFVDNLTMEQMVERCSVHGAYDGCGQSEDDTGAKTANAEAMGARLKKQKIVKFIRNLTVI
jgi:hypothetical protein